jgi:hypothetical protein
MIKTMMAIFFVFSILVTPAIYLYASNNGLEGLSNYSKAQFSLGNIGYSVDMCRSMYLGLEKPQTFACREGSIAKLNSFGLIPLEFERKDFCGKSTDQQKINDCN